MAVKVSAAIQSGEPFSDASRNGKRDCEIHLFSSSYPLGNAGFLGTPFADDQTVGFHEYFHTVQHAYIFTLDRGTREDMLGPMWFVEGGAEFMAQTTTQRLRDDGASTASKWPSLPERMEWKTCRSGPRTRSERRIPLRRLGARLSTLGGQYGRTARVVLQKLDPSRLGRSFHPDLWQDIGAVYSRVR